MILQSQVQSFQLHYPYSLRLFIIILLNDQLFDPILLEPLCSILEIAIASDKGGVLSNYFMELEPEDLKHVVHVLH